MRPAHPGERYSGPVFTGDLMDEVHGEVGDLISDIKAFRLRKFHFGT
jgi:hypothetical protein